MAPVHALLSWSQASVSPGQKCHNMLLCPSNWSMNSIFPSYATNVENVDNYIIQHLRVLWGRLPTWSIYNGSHTQYINEWCSQSDSQPGIVLQGALHVHGAAHNSIVSSLQERKWHALTKHIWTQVDPTKLCIQYTPKKHTSVLKDRDDQMMNSHSKENVPLWRHPNTRASAQMVSCTLQRSSLKS